MKNLGPYILALDVGTSATKAGIYDLGGRERGTAVAEYPTAYPRPTWAEQDPRQWWDAALASIKQSLQKAEIKPEAVKGISISGQAPSCVAVDRRMKPLRPAILWIDRRATDEVEWIASEVGAEKVREVSGNTIDAYFGGPKWLWFRNKEPDLFKRTWKILQAHSYIIYQLSGEIVTDPSHAGLCSPCFDLHKKEWSDEICGALGIDVSLLPEVAPSHQIVGKVSRAGSEVSGLVRGTPIVTGGGDFACATLGCGVMEVGQAAQMLGTAGNLLVPMGESIDPDPRLVNTIHVTGDYLTVGSIYAGGVIQWFREQLGEPEVLESKRSGKTAYRLLDEKAANIESGADGLILLPYFMGERTPIWDPYARGVYVGLTPYHTRAHMYRAALEGIAFAFRHMVEIIREQEVRIEEVIAVNGGAKSRLWRQIFADVLGVRVHYSVGGAATLLGDVALAGVGVGYFSSLDVVKGWQEIAETQEPNPLASARYSEYYTVYRQIYLQLREQFKELYQIARAGLRDR